jgi:hypothetical protein
VNDRVVRCVLALALLVGFGTARAAASPIIVSGTEVLTGTHYTANFMQGYDFTATTSLSLTALGFWDANSDGLLRAFSVGLWNTATQTLLASASIDNADPISGGVVSGGAWRYETLGAPVALVSGQTYTLAWQTGPTDLTNVDTLLLDYPTVAFDPNVAVPNIFRYLSTAGFAFPPNTFPADDQFRAMVNAQIDAVPEPATLLLLGAGVGTLAARRRANRRS